ncbi:MAG: hypothetical protein F4Y03_07210 [Alphaproteobacteria bacterium]|nr:hypothetical protein [Alphaproteobacteria bacterium]
MDPALITAWATVAIAASTVIVGGATCFLIWRGLKAMDRSSDERAHDRRAAADDLKAWRDDLKAWREADTRRHEESMTALRALIERTGPIAPAE